MWPSTFAWFIHFHLKVRPNNTVIFGRVTRDHLTNSSLEQLMTIVSDTRLTYVFDPVGTNAHPKLRPCIFLKDKAVSYKLDRSSISLPTNHQIQNLYFRVSRTTSYELVPDHTVRTVVGRAFRVSGTLACP